MEKIKFGTDGWRGVIAEDFTFKNVRIVTQAIADYVRRSGSYKRGLLVGYDTRFLSDKYAETCALVLASRGIPVVLTDRPTPTPAVSFTIRERGMAGGIMVTASHNPPEYNGIKFKPHYGGSATTEITKEIEKFLGEREVGGGEEIGEEKGEAVKTEDISKPYMEKLKSYINLTAINNSGMKVIIDPMYGTGSGYLPRILGDKGGVVVTIHGERNPLFGGLPPEPLAKNLGELSMGIRELGADIGLAMDGDADRVGVMDEQGEFVNSHQVFALILLHLIKSRGWKGGVVKTVSTTTLLDKIAQRYGLKLYETPIGFKYICELMLKEDVLMGGEESGGLGVKNHIPERDGILISLLMLELLALENKPLSRLLAEIRREYGPYYYHREDLDYPLEKKEALYQKLRSNPPREISGLPVIKVNTLDGIKFILAEDSWLLIRGSGTEPLLRIYGEADDPEKLERIMERGKEIVFS